MQQRRYRHAALLGLFAAASVAGWPRTARATSIPSIYDNYQMYPIGSRAAGMGGAYTALGCDEAAIHYNPAALACSSHSRLELAANVYQLQAVDIPNALGKGQDVSAVTFNSIPSIVGGVRVLMDGEEDGSGRLVFGLSVEVPHSVAIKAQPAKPDSPNYISFSVRDDMTTSDVGLAYQFNRYFGAGISIGAALRTYESHYNQLVISREKVLCIGGFPECWEFYAVATEEEALAVGARGKLGLRFTPTEELSFGLTVVSPSIDIYGSASLLETNTYALLLNHDPLLPAFNPYPVRLSGSSDLSSPFRLAIGGAYSTPSFTISIDASVNFPHTVDMAYDLEAEEFPGFAALTKDELEELTWRLERGVQPNANVGIEFAVAEDVVIDTGLFTDLSSVVKEEEDQIHMFGATLALGLLGKQARTWVGASFEFGMADVQVSSGTLDLNTIIDEGGLPFDDYAMATRWTLAGFLGSSYSFFPEEEEEEPAAPAGAAPPPPPPGGTSTPPGTVPGGQQRSSDPWAVL